MSMSLETVPKQPQPANQVTISPLAGKPAPKEMLIDVARLERIISSAGPTSVTAPTQWSFGTSGHRGSPLHGTFTEAHILAITQAICDYRSATESGWPALWARTRTPSPIRRSARRSKCWPRTASRRLFSRMTESLRAGHLASHPRLQPRPKRASRGRHRVTPSHNPPEDGGFKYNPPTGARRYRRDAVGGKSRQRIAPRSQCRRETRSIRLGHPVAESTHQEDFVLPYVRDLRNVVDMDAIRGAGLKLAVDPLGGASRALLGPDQLRSINSTSRS
jgi:phosphoglucomutase